MIKLTDKSNLTEKTIVRIMDYIRDRKLGPGDALPTEVELLKMFGVSRNILRESLNYLKGLGIITSRRGSAFKVAQIDLSRVMSRVLPFVFSAGSMNTGEILQLRKIMELGAVESAVMGAREEDIVRIEKALNALVEYEETRKDNWRQVDFILLESEFHSAITAPAGCKSLNVLNEAIREYFIRSKDMFKDDKYSESVSRTNMEHRIIALAFRNRDPETAFSCLRRHFHNLEHNRRIAQPGNSPE